MPGGCPILSPIEQDGRGQAIRNKIIGLVLAVLLLAGGWYWASPLMALSGLKDALVEGDRTELSERIDFPAVRESLKSQLKAMMVAEMAKHQDNPMAALGMAIGMGLATQVVDGIVTPDGLKAMIENGRMQDPGKAPTVSPAKTEVDWTIARKGLDRFEATPEAKDGQTTDKAPTLVFRREGLGWKLVDIIVPRPAETKEPT